MMKLDALQELDRIKLEEEIEKRDNPQAIIDEDVRWEQQLQAKMKQEEAEERKRINQAMKEQIEALK